MSEDAIFHGFFNEFSAKLNSLTDDQRKSLLASLVMSLDSSVANNANNLPTRSSSSPQHSHGHAGASPPQVRTSSPSNPVSSAGSWSTRTPPSSALSPQSPRNDALERKQFLEVETAIYAQLVSGKGTKHPLLAFRRFDQSNLGRLSRNGFCAAIVASTGLLLTSNELDLFIEKYGEQNNKMIIYEKFLKHLESKTLLNPSTTSAHNDYFTALLNTRGVTLITLRIALTA